MIEPKFAKMEVELIGSYGNDELISEVAGISTMSPNKSEEHIEKRIKQLMFQGHSSLQEFGDIHLKIKAPLFVAVQWLRHRMSSFNMQSGRRTKMFEFYIPNEREDVNEKMCEIIQDHCWACMNTYNQLLDGGTPLEVCRSVLPENIMTNFHYKANLRSVFNFIKLRDDFHAQWEIQELAKVVSAVVEREFPLVYKYWNMYGRS